MKIKAQWLMWLALPAIFFACATNLREARGPWFLSPAYDPDYAYLLNGLNLAIGLPPKHVDHPGTPLQLGLAGFIRAKNPGLEPGKTALNVINGIEAYLLSANRLLLAAITIALVLTGLLVTRITGHWQCGLIAQASPFLMGGNFQYFTRVSPEPVLLLLSLLLLLPLLRLVQLEPDQEDRRWTLLLAFGLATAIAVKINAIPLLLLALVFMPGWRARTMIAAVTLAGVVAWTLPIASRYREVALWIWSLATKLGVYGRGDTGLVKPADYSAGLCKLLYENPVFTITLAASVIGLWLCRGARRETASPEARWWRLLAALTLAQLAQWIISSKNPQSRYLAPAQGLIALNWIALYFLPAHIPDKLQTRCRQGFRIGLAVALLICPASFWQLRAEFQVQAKAKLALAEHVRARSGECATIFHYGASSLLFALPWASNFAGNAYHDLLNQMIQPEARGIYFLNHWSGEVFTLEKKTPIRDILAKWNCVLLEGDQLQPEELRFLPEDYTAEPLAKSGDEVLYRVRKK